MEQAYRNLGLASFIVFGVALIMLGASVIALFGYVLSLGRLTTEVSAISSLLIVAGTLYVVIGMIVMSLGPRFKREEMGWGRVILSIILYSIILILFAASLFVIDLTSTAILYTIGGVLIIVAALVYIPRSISARVVASIFGLVAISILLASIATLPGNLRFYYDLYQGYGSLIFASTLGSAAFLIACVSALLYAFLAKGGYQRIVFLVLGVTATIFGIGIIVNSLDPLVTLPWRSYFEYAPATLSAIMVLLILALVISTISGFLILATAGISFAVHGRELASAGPARATARAPAARPEPAREHTSFCKNCGAPIDKGDKFCGRCGLKISTR
jgi:hypothetical protein